jgi:hypothetical protein
MFPKALLEGSYPQDARMEDYLRSIVELLRAQHRAIHRIAELLDELMPKCLSHAVLGWP